MLKSIFSKAFIYIIILVLIVLAVVFYLFGNLSKKQVGNSATPISFSISSSSPSSQNVPLPSKEDTIRAFCNLIDEGRISDAVSMMDIKDDTIKQAWGVSLNNFSSFKLKNIKNSSLDETGNSFEVDIDVKLKENLTNLPIPNYGWDDGLNKRWIGVVDKGDSHYKIVEIATGP